MRRIAITNLHLGRYFGGGNVVQRRLSAHFQQLPGIASLAIDARIVDSSSLHATLARMVLAAQQDGLADSQVLSLGRVLGGMLELIESMHSLLLVRGRLKGLSVDVTICCDPIDLALLESGSVASRCIVLIGAMPGLPELLTRPSRLRDKLVGYGWRVLELRKQSRLMYVALNSSDFNRIDRSLFDHVVLIPHGTDVNKFRPARRAVARNSVLSVGRLDSRQKRGTLLIEAISMLQDLKAELTFVGDGPDRSEYVACARRLGVEGVVHFKGKVDDAGLVAAYEASKVFASASRYETFGLSTLEAMASGLPIVSTTNDGSRELVTDGVTGFLVQPNPADLSEGIRKLLVDDALRERFGSAGRQKVEAHYNESSEFAAYDRLTLPFLSLGAPSPGSTEPD